MPSISEAQAMAIALDHHQHGRLAEAEAIYRQVLAQSPNCAEAWQFLGVLAHQKGRNDLAIDFVQRAIALQPADYRAHNHLGVALAANGQSNEAISSFRASIQLKADHAEAYYNMAGALKDLRNVESAIDAYRTALRFKPDWAQAHNNLGIALRELGRMESAVEAFRAAIALDRNLSEAYCNLGMALKDRALLDPAAEAFTTAVKLNPHLAAAYNNLGVVLRERGQAADAIPVYEKAIQTNPDYADAHSNLLLTLNCTPRSDLGLRAEHEAWAQQHAARFYPRSPRFNNDRTVDRKLRIGYVSPDFRRHSVAYFFEPILTAHDPTQFEVFCYSNVMRPDELTESMRQRAHAWHDISGLSDENAFALIQQDRIDILVDLAGHTANHRLLLFARKPAPVQITYLGYPNTTGIQTIDYRLTDEECDPTGMTESHHTEQLVRLPNGFLCYQPPQPCPEVRAPDDGSITFGSFNNLGKVTREMIALWAQILSAVDGSRLLLKAEGLGSEEARKQLLDQFARRGINSDRIELLGRIPSVMDHLSMYHRVAIGLDTFPYHGTTTTCEALWMGVPVVTLAGHAHVSRVGVSILKRVGLSGLVAASATDYVRLACEIARDSRRRREIARELRDRMRSSDLTDAVKFVAVVEKAYRQMWLGWLEGSST